MLDKMIVNAEKFLLNLLRYRAILDIIVWLQ